MDTKAKKGTAAGGGLAVAVILAWAAEQAGLTMPGEVVAAAAAVIGYVAHWVGEAVSEWSD